MTTVTIGAADVDAADLIAFLLDETRWQALYEAELPRLSLVPPTEDEPLAAFACPHCGERVDEPVMFDLSLRASFDASVTLDLRWIAFNYGDVADYHGLALACPHCERPVSAPEGWHVE